MSYEINVCPVCGEQWNCDSEYGWSAFGDCKHVYSLWDEYGTHEPLIVQVGDLVAERVEEARQRAIPWLKEMREKRAAEKARQEAERKAKWDAMTPQERLDAQMSAAKFSGIMKNVFAGPILSELNKSTTFLWGDAR